jgi:Mrp family chromosome partitioning ATPase
LTAATNASPALEKFDLNGKAFDKRDLQPMISKTAVSKIDVIGCAGGDYTPSEILPKNHLLNYLRQLEDEYDFIFMEGAPLNGFTDTKELERYAEGLIAIFSAEAALTPADKESIRFFHEHKDKFLGAILNKVEEPNLEM